MKLTSLLRWGSRRAAAETSGRQTGGDRRRAPRLPAEGAGWVFWTDAEGAACRTRVRFADIGADGSGLGFVARKPLPAGAVCWAQADDAGEAAPARVRHCEPLAQGTRVGVSLDFEQRELPGAGGATIRWVDGQGVLVRARAELRASGQALVEMTLDADVPSGTPLCLSGPSYGCLAVCRGSRFEGGRFVILAEACTEAFALDRAA